MSDTMHDSTSGSLRPRQRTFTSCTECRRRKQKCNQAKDRPCSNCARRYPPPICTYQSSSPTPPPMDHGPRVESNRDSHMSNHVYPESESYDSASAHQYYGSPATTSSSASQSMYDTSHGHQSSSSSSRTDSRYYSGNTNNYQATVATSSEGDYYPTTTGYYQNDHMGYSTADNSHDYSYLATSDDQQWLSSGDADVFVGTGTSEYYYVDETEPPRTAGPRR